MIVGTFRATQFAFQNFWRNLWLSVITVFLIVLTTLSITLVVGLNIIGREVIHAVEEKVDINLYFHPYVKEQNILEAQSFLLKEEGVSEVIYISQEDAEEQFRANHVDDTQLLASLDEIEESIFPASLNVRATALDAYPQIIDAFKKSEFTEFVEEADYNDSQAIISTIQQITERVYSVGIGVSLIFICISVIVIFNTIRIAIYNHREEVGIMKLVGATNWFIRAPFILESIFLGLVSAAVTLVVFSVLLVVADPFVSAFFAGYDFSLLQYFMDHAVTVVAIEVGGAILLSVASSMIAITRYLKV